MKNDGEIRLVCFDWGGVIVRICRSWAQGCEAAGLPVRDGSAEPAHVERRGHIVRRFQNGLLSSEAFIRELARSTLGLYTTAEVRAIHNAWLLEEYAGVGGIVRELNETEGLATALLSNTNEMHFARQHPGDDGRPADFPTASRLDHHFASHLLGVSKPSPEIYHAVERATGRSPGEILFFDDTEDNITAARRLGWRAELIDHTGDVASQLRRCLGAHGVR